MTKLSDKEYNKQWLLLSERLIEAEGVELDPKLIIQRPLCTGSIEDRKT